MLLDLKDVAHRDLGTLGPEYGPAGSLKKLHLHLHPIATVKNRSRESDVDVGFVTHFIAGGDSDIVTVEDLIGKRFAFGRRGSEQAGLVPYHMLKQAGLNPQKDLAAISFFFAGIHYMATGGKLRYPAVEPLLVVANLAAYLGLLFTFLGPVYAVLFIMVHKAVEGVYMGSVFAPNHKAMPVLAPDAEIGFMRQQIITSRNVKAHPVTDFIYGGLNCQIEHHLFPNMPRNNLRKAQAIVKEFCKKHGISYHETSVLGSQKEIIGHLHRMSAPLRGKAA